MHPLTDALVGRLAGAHVVCVGDAMLDRFVYGAVTRVSPEAPIPICHIEHESAMPGGAGNVLRNLLALGASAQLFCVRGDDAAGDELAAMLTALPRATIGALVEPGRQTTVKTRFIAGAQQLLRADRETVAPISAALADRLAAAAAHALDGAGALVLSDYGKGALAGSLTRRLIDAANRAGVPVVVDPKGTDFSIYRGAQLVTPNRHELAAASRQACATDAEIVAASRHIVAGCGIEAVVATRGAHGMTLVTGERTAHFPAEAREVFDVSGAGDTVVAALAAGLAAGIAIDDAMVLANVAAGIVVGKQGTAVAYADDLVAALRASDPSRGEHKVMATGAALDRIAAWRARGARIGFTNGCFDLIHPGHVSLLAQAKAACDRLVVGLNADASVARLKGSGRPVQSEAARAAVLGSLASVDLVMVFSEDTPMRLIEAIRPDVLVKGADYAPGEVVGGDFVRGTGGKVLLAELTPGHSTTATIARMAR